MATTAKAIDGQRIETISSFYLIMFDDLAWLNWNLLTSFQSLNSILSSNNPDDIPLTDFTAAAGLPYDTYIPEGKK